MAAALCEIDSTEQRCRVCSSTALYTDWAQGDRICTSCGLVQEGHLMDTGPEWREYNNPDDSSKPSVSRCGLVANNEELFLGGLEPTYVSAYTVGDYNPTIRKKLAATNRKIDYMMHKQHGKALSAAQLERQVKQRKRYRSQDEEDEPAAVSFDASCDNIRPELEQMVLQEEEQANRLRTAMYAEKWSLQRAIRWHEQPDNDDEPARQEVALQRAARDLHTAHGMLVQAAERLGLGPILPDATRLLCRYATHRDGLTVRGVAVARRNNQAVDNTTSRKRKRVSQSRQRLVAQAAKDALQEYNKVKQCGALCAAILFMTARNLKRPRSLVEVCQSIHVPTEMSNTNSNCLSEECFIRKKHCSKAMKEIKEVFPEFSKTVASPDGVTTLDDASKDAAATNFAEHTLRKLRLPPVAETSVQCLLHRLQRTTDKKVAIAAVAFFLCQAGSTMQRLAQQSQQRSERPPARKRPSLGASSSNENGSFQSFVQEQKAYESRRMWDAWCEQTVWARSLSQIESCCGVSKKLVAEFYQRVLYPKRQELLESLQNAVTAGRSTEAPQTTPTSSALHEIPQASVLLTKVTAAGPLMKLTV